MNPMTFYTFVILAWVFNVLFCVGLIVFLARHQRDNRWAFAASVILPILSFLLFYNVRDAWLILNLLSSSIPIAAGAYLRVDIYENSRYEKYMKINFLIIALLFVPGLSNTYISYAYWNFTPYVFGNLGVPLLFLTVLPTFAVVGSMRGGIFSTNLLFGCLFGGIGCGLSELFYFNWYNWTIPVIENLGIVLFCASGIAIVLAFIGMVFWKPSDSDSMGKYKKFKF